MQQRLVTSSLEHIVAEKSIMLLNFLCLQSSAWLKSLEVGSIRLKMRSWHAAAWQTRQTGAALVSICSSPGTSHRWLLPLPDSALHGCSRYWHQQSLCLVVCLAALCILMQLVFRACTMAHFASSYAQSSVSACRACRWSCLIWSLASQQLQAACRT